LARGQTLNVWVLDMSTINYIRKVVKGR
jgi:hypothetical protein